MLVAKQAAEIDILSGGRMRLGIGIGWQWQEFDALTANFRQRPSRMEEYIRVLRACWTEEPITFSGRYVNIDQMSVMPKPVTPGGPPILFGGFAQAAIERTARLGDGWIAPVQSTVEQLAELIGRLREHSSRPTTATRTTSPSNGCRRSTPICRTPSAC